MDQQNNNPKDTEKKQDHPVNEVREGQEDSSILHDKKDPKKELIDVTQKDISSENKEEFIDDKKNTTRRDD